MSRRSDVSKMLVSRHTSGGGGSSVGSVVGARGGSRVGLSRVVGTQRSVAESVDQKAKPGPPSQPSQIPAKSYGFLQMKCLDVLKKSPAPMHIQELQVALGSEFLVASDREFLTRLRANPRVNFDPTTKRWSFMSPYRFLVTSDAILTHLREKKELEINSEVLEYNKDVPKWVNEILSKRIVRAVRGTKNSRCKVFSAESGLYCDLYSPDERCDGCKSLQGVVLYQRGADAIENVEIDADLKELWHKITPTPAVAVEALMGAKKRPAGSNAEQGKSKRRKPVGARAPRIQKIANVHMYSAEEFKEALAAETAAALAKENDAC